MLASADEQALAAVAAMCACGCGRLVAPGRKFVNQQLYDLSKGCRHQRASERGSR
jgi:hypothetical protein